MVELGQKQVGGTKRDSVVVDLDASLRVTLSLEEASVRLRAVADKNEVEDVRRTLVAESSPLDTQCKSRVKESKAKLASGRHAELAEIIRDGSRFERLRGSESSDAERRVYHQARELLIREISSACGREQVEAEIWIEAQNALSGRNED